MSRKRERAGMSSSRRRFLKSTVAGAGVALGGLRGLANPPGKSASAVGSAANGPKQAATESPQGSAGFTRGVGIYPGNPAEDFSPVLAPAPPTYRNLALHRPAYHSTSYDYNLTAQLVTDGIKDTHLPDWVATSISFRGLLSKIEREFFLDHNPTSTVELRGPQPWVQVQLGGGESAPEIDRVEVLFLAPRGQAPQNLTVAVSVSDNGRAWKKAGSVTGPQPASIKGYPPGFATPRQLFQPSIPLSVPSHSRFYRVEFEVAKAPPMAFFMVWQLGEVAFFHRNHRVEVGGPYRFTSAWMSAGLGEEWVYVDLGASCEFDHVVLSWIARAAEGSLQVSDDAKNWQDIQALPSGEGTTDDIKLPQPARGRYVRVLMKRPTSPYGYILSEIEVYGRGGLIAQPKPPALGQDARRLDLAGGAWRLERASVVNADGKALSTPGFKDDDWVVATVPGTVLSSYVNVGAVADPNYADNQFFISDSYFCADFWYRNEFTVPDLPEGQRAWLNFDGINWKADVFLNGEKLGRIEGGFMRGRFDVTGILRAGQKNALAVRVVEQAVSVDAQATKKMKLDPSTHPTLRLQNPKLWWPAGYGEPNLYEVELKFETDNGPSSDVKRFKAGVREMSYSTAGGLLKIWVNGRRFVARGGNWGFGESMLRYRAREYDAAVRYHRDMNFTMIRNWVGQIGGDAFYEACDRHGVMVWQDFWLANPWDGPDPKDNDLFMRNVRDTVLRIRNHPSIGLYCGRNEGYPPKPLEDGIRKALAENHPGIQYIPSSADDVVSGHGPYQAMPPSFYFSYVDPKLHSEMGMPNIPPIESVRAMMPESALWPQGLIWGLHDFCLEGAQGGDSFRRMIEFNYGGATNAEEWVRLAQFVNYEGYRAMFEAQSKYRMGLL
ncbi:MAG: discoidin domain-containing protein, partial [Acidobacteriia bacterium]|nr:discoidin domain-containing protein [Terriglobia bacterium]